MRDFSVSDFFFSYASFDASKIGDNKRYVVFYDVTIILYI